MHADKKWRRLTEKTLYKGRVHLKEYTAQLPDGRQTQYEVLHSDHGSAGVLIKSPDGNLILNYQYRFPIDKYIYDLPGGVIDDGETSEQAAMRECMEELGIKPLSLKPLLSFYPNPGRSDWLCHIYFCDDFIEQALKHDDLDETIERRSVPLDDFRQMLNSGEIVDPFLLVAYYTALRQGLLG